MISKLNNIFEVGMWYCDTKARSLSDKQYLYKCKYCDKDIAVLERYSDGSALGTFSTPNGGNKYQLSQTNNINQLIDFYKNNKFSLVCEINDSLLSITNNISIIHDLDLFFDKHEKKQEYTKSHNSIKCDRLYEETISLLSERNYIEEIQKFISRS